MGHFAVQVFVPVLLLPGFLFLYCGHKALQFRPGLLGACFVGLAFLDVAYGLLHLTAGTLDYALGLLACILEYFLALALNVFELLLILFRKVFQFALGVLYLFDFPVQHPPVAGNAPEILLYVHKVLSGPRFGIFDNVLRQFHPACELEGEGVARKTDLQGEQRLNPGGVEKHCAVGDMGIPAGCVEFQVGVVGGNHTPASAFVQFCEYSLGDCAAGGRLST